MLDNAAVYTTQQVIFEDTLILLFRSKRGRCLLPYCITKVVIVIDTTKALSERKAIKERLAMYVLIIYILQANDYNVVKENEEYGMFNIEPGFYTFWATNIRSDGSHGLWQRGPQFAAWNSTGDVVMKNYTVNITFVPELNDHNVKAIFTWNNSDGNIQFC